MWGGLVNIYYKLCWELFELYFVDVILNGIEFKFDKFNVVVLDYEIKWIQGIIFFLDVFVGDILIIVKKLYGKYRFKND